MRKRNIRKQYFLNEEENDELRRKSIKAGMTESNLIRSLIMDYQPREKPPEKFYDYISLLRILNNNMNQIAMKAHTYDYIDEEFYLEQVKILNDFIKEVKFHYLNSKKDWLY